MSTTFLAQSVPAFAIHFAYCVFYLCFWNPLAMAAVYMWYHMLAWYYDIDDYRDVPYTPLPIETIPIETNANGLVATTYTVRCCGPQVYTLLQGADEQCLPTSDDIRELVATSRNADDESAIDIKLAMIDVDNVQTMNVTSILRSVMGPFNSHLQTYQQNAVSKLSNGKLLTIFTKLWLADYEWEWHKLARLDITVHIQNKHTHRLRQLNTLDFLLDPQHLQDICKSEQALHDTWRNTE